MIGGLGYLIGANSRSSSDSSSPTTAPAAPAAAGVDAITATTATPDDQPSWLLTQTAKFGTMTPNADGTYELVMQGVDPEVVAFTDRPFRDTGLLTTQQMVNSWGKAFADAAPNGVLVAHHIGQPADSTVVELFNPRVDGTTMTYTVRVLADENTSKNIVGDTTTTAVPTPPATFALASLFIDNLNLRYACLTEDGFQDEIYPPGDVPPGGPTQAWYAQCKAAGGGIGETFG